jgi:hypothetical protein
LFFNAHRIPPWLIKITNRPSSSLVAGKIKKGHGLGAHRGLWVIQTDYRRNACWSTGALREGTATPGTSALKPKQVESVIVRFNANSTVCAWFLSLEFEETPLKRIASYHAHSRTVKMNLLALQELPWWMLLLREIPMTQFIRAQSGNQPISSQ